MTVPYFSVIITTFNRSGHIAGAAAAVLGQTFGDLELVLVDDGSTDDTAAALAAIDDDRVVAVHRPNGGISAARNSGAAAARGRFLCFADDDDRPDEVWLEALHRELERTGSAIVSCGARLVDHAGTVHDVRRPESLGPLFGGARGFFLPGTFAVERGLFARAGGFTEGLEFSHLTDLNLRLLPLARAEGSEVAWVDDPLVTVERRAADDRPAATPEKLLEGTIYLLTAYSQQLARAPRALARFESITGVAAVRLGDPVLARGHFWRAVRAEPGTVRNWGRLGLSCIPPLARLAWRGPSG